MASVRHVRAGAVTGEDGADGCAFHDRKRARFIDVELGHQAPALRPRSERPAFTLHRPLEHDGEGASLRLDYEGELECEVDDEGFCARVVVMDREVTGHGAICDEARENLLQVMEQAARDETLPCEVREEMHRAFLSLGGEEM